MLGLEATLPKGRVFELEVFGFLPDDLNVPFSPMENKEFEKSLQDVIVDNWVRFAKAKEKNLAWHDPARPQMGKTEILWTAVKRHLPRRGKNSYYPLNLYVAIGRNHLDCFYGVDALFWWNGVYVSLDISTAVKWHGGWGKHALRADFLVGPDDLTPLGADRLGKRIASLLRKRRLELNWNIRQEHLVRCGA